MSENESNNCFFPYTKNLLTELSTKEAEFNREDYPDLDFDDFANAVAKVIEKRFKVRFEKNKPPYDRIDDEKDA